MSEGGFYCRSLSRPVESSDLTEEILVKTFKLIGEYIAPQPYIVSPKRYKEIMNSPELRRLYGVEE